MGLEWVLYPLAGVLAGLMAGLLGVGGGLVLMPILVFVLPHQGVDEASVMPMALATSLASIFLTGISSAYAETAWAERLRPGPQRAHDPGSSGERHGDALGAVDHRHHAGRARPVAGDRPAHPGG